MGIALETSTVVPDYFIASLKEWSAKVIEIVNDQRYVFQDNSGNFYYDLKRDILGWSGSLRTLILDNIPSCDLYYFINFVIESKSILELTMGGSSFENCDFSIGEDKLDTITIGRLLYVVRWELMKIYKAAGYDVAIDKVIPHYSKHNTTLHEILDLTGLPVDGIGLLPLEHGLFLIRHSLEFHQDY